MHLNRNVAILYVLNLPCDGTREYAIDDPVRMNEQTNDMYHSFTQ